MYERSSQLALALSLASDSHTYDFLIFRSQLYNVRLFDEILHLHCVLHTLVCLQLTHGTTGHAPKYHYPKIHANAVKCHPHTHTHTTLKVS